MAKITKKFQRIFANDVPVDNVIAEFGSLKKGTPAYSKDPDLVQVHAAWDDGLQSAMINSYNPTIQDLNALFYVITRQIAYFQQQGIPEWCSNTTYYTGSLVMQIISGTYRKGVAIFESLADNNLNQALTNQSKWRVKTTNIQCNYSSGDGGITTDIGYNEYMYTVFNGASTPLSVYLPTPNSSMAGREIIVENRWFSGTGGADSKSVRVYVKNSETIEGNAYIDLARSGSTAYFICDGTHWYLINFLVPDIA